MRINLDTIGSPSVDVAITAFKTWLASQYANGTPVTVWYVLAEPEIGIVNEPLMKIGDYADTISLPQSGITVPTTVGTNTITTETTVLPSNISVTTPEKEVAEVYAGINYQSPIYYKSRTITGQTPLSYKALSKPLSDYLISGNTIQNGVPTPEAPVDVVGCGVRTGNLYDYRKTFAPDVIVHSEYFTYYLLALQPNTTYTAYTNCESRIRQAPNRTSVTFIIVPDEIPFTTVNGGVYKNTPKTFTTQNSGLVKVGIRTLEESVNPIPVYQENDFANGEQWLMLNEGSTALPYEPYGYKLPLTVNGTDYPIYLGEVPTTRRIKKLVLTGKEGWAITSNGVLRIGLSGQLRLSTPLCTHYLGSNSTAWSNVPDKSVTVSISGFLAILDTTYTAAADFKSYLAAQYAAGTPVTIWYVLANEETGTVNEPLMKIGDYADTITMAQAGVTIPTVAGVNALAVDTTVQPSEVSITGNIKPVI